MKFEKQTIFWLLDITCIITGYLLIKLKQEKNRIPFNKESSVNINILISNYSFYLIPILAFFISMVLAYLSLYPFSPRSRVSLYLQAHFNLIVIGLVGFIYYIKHLDINEVIGSDRLNLLSTVLIATVVALSLSHGYLYSQYEIIYRGGGAQHTPQVVRKILADEEIKNIDYWYISLGEANTFKYHVLYGDLKGKLSSDARIVFEKSNSDQEKIGAQLLSIYKNAKPGDEIVMVTGHAGENDKKYMPKFIETFKNNVKIGKFVESSMFGEHSLGGEQAYLAVR